jgi:hypothetical protein
MLRVRMFFFIGVMAIAFLATAEPKKKPKINQSMVGEAIKNLNNPNPEEVMDSIQILEASGSKRAVEPLCDLLRTGPRTDITDSAIQALGAIGDKGALSTLMEYMGHRRPSARTMTIYALESQKDAKVTTAFENALRDSDSQVRSTAALALGKRNSASSVPILFLAFDRGVDDAVIAIGQIGAPDDAKRLATYLGKADINVLLTGFDEFLKRDAFPKEAKMAILESLFELAGPDVKRFAVAYKASFPPGTSEKNALYELASRMVRQIQEN